MSYISTLFPAYAEIFLLCMICVIMIVDSLLPSQTRTVTYLLTQVTLLGCSLITVATHTTGVAHLFTGMFVDDLMSDVLKLLTYLSVSMMLVYSRSYLIVRGLFTGELLSLTLTSTLGMLVMISASNFVTLYIGLEVLALSMYALVALQRDSAVATESAMKYFILGAMASGFLLYGMSMIYGGTGSLDIQTISNVIKAGQGNDMLLVFGLAFLVAGLAFKLGAVPFHMWVPDVYHGAPTAMTMFIGTAPKLAAFAFVMRILVEALQPMMIHWAGMLAVLAVLSMGVGNITAIAQTNIKRMFAYSTIAHMGFLLLGVLSGTLDGYSSAMFYAVIYVLMTLGGFGMIMLLSREGFEADNLNDFKGLNQRSPWLAFMMLLLMFSMAGVPPTVGFYAKFSVLNAALQAGHLTLVIAAVIFSLIGAFYYLRIVKLMYFDAPESHEKLYMQPDSTLLVSINGLAVLMLGIMPNTLMAICAASVQQSLLLP
ncbi:MAG: NADH-quinone oxidoreductase subunit NuoN [Gammaproteobacteria bacterium]|nr:NADH-quinone oxidoreductase subunit NuoN [Sideroxydans sp.]MBU3904316.1 NADH-quinone oxidoreductase subunit NuoN [Gammaproteobacteria bacterium]MBU4045062.1 NADH-quinone oxidoreductase subunit NuoN [Gammaproteobacteria bacterium]MBU4150911.1 NADH-quinone oxidoreductase subunit NuoN [Gammaproteobacteria bacterium]